jgi:hypothetical protein
VILWLLAHHVHDDHAHVRCCSRYSRLHLTGGCGHSCAAAACLQPSVTCTKPNLSPRIYYACCMQRALLRACQHDAEVYRQLQFAVQLSGLCMDYPASDYLLALLNAAHHPSLNCPAEHAKHRHTTQNVHCEHALIESTALLCSDCSAPKHCPSSAAFTRGVYNLQPAL